MTLQIIRELFAEGISDKRGEKMAKIMHISDLHLDCALSELDEEKREIRRAEIKESFENAIDYAVENKAEVILISGDVFDSPCPLKSTVEFVKKTLNAVKAYVFISPGNHDPYTSKAYKELEKELNPNVKIFKDAFECVDLPNLNMRIYGRGFMSECEPSSLLKGFRVIDDDMASIVVIHGEVTSGESSYNPIDIKDIAQSGADYIALGHTHAFSQICRAENTCYAYCGTHEGHGFDECGDKGFIFGDVEKGNVKLKFVPLCKRKYYSFETDVSDCEIIEDISSKMNEIIEKNGSENLYKFILTGYRNADLRISESVLKSRADAFFVKVYDRARVKADFESIATEKNLRGICIKNILNDINDENREKLEKVLDFFAELF